MALNLKPAAAIISARFRLFSRNIARWPRSAPSGPKKLPPSGRAWRNADEVRRAARRLRRDVNSALDSRRMNEMFAHVGNAFEEHRLMPDRDVIEQNEVLVNLPHVADVRHHRQSEFPREQAHRDELGNPREPRAIRLHEMQRL